MTEQAEQVNSLSHDDFTAVLRVAQAEGTGTGMGLRDVRAKPLPEGSALVYFDSPSLRKS